MIIISLTLIAPATTEIDSFSYVQKISAFCMCEHKGQISSAFVFAKHIVQWLCNPHPMNTEYFVINILNT